MNRKRATSEQIARQRRSRIASQSVGDRVLEAIAKSPWGSQTAYAARLGVSTTMLLYYRTGKNPTPRDAAEKMRDDLKIPLTHWSRLID